MERRLPIRVIRERQKRPVKRGSLSEINVSGIPCRRKMRSKNSSAVASAVTVVLTAAKWVILLSRSTKTTTPVFPEASRGKPKMKSMLTDFQ